MVSRLRGLVTDSRQAHREDDKMWFWVKAAVSCDSPGDHVSGMVEVR